ncbi:helix-turn-helix domain-containing protein [Acinetobacter thermotolerans]|uniref:helix-turn-helix domain-containing protein n=1 Tax=Acinetobacter thermotolerans TaxID=3151487 RepID=UPI00325BED7A
MKQTVENQVLEHLKSGKTITSIEAMHMWNCCRLSAVIHSLRSDGHPIEKIWEPNNKKTGMHARYFYANNNGEG